MEKDILPEVEVQAKALREVDVLPYHDLIDGQLVEAALKEENLRFRVRIYTPLITLWTFMTQVLDADHSCRKAVRSLTAFLVSEGQPAICADTSNYCKARKRLPLSFIVRLVRKLGELLDGKASAEWLWNGREVHMVDGSSASMPDTPANQRAFPQPAGQKPGVGFPLARFVTIVSLATGAVRDLAIGPCKGKRDRGNELAPQLLGCGSAYYAGQMGAVLTEELARIPSDAEPASEFRYRNPVVDPDTLYVAVSQSGETLDTLMAVQELQRKGGQVIGAVNVVGSAIGRECGHGIFLHAGPEIAVASTKALTNMAATFAMLALLLGRVRDLSSASGQRIVAGLRALPRQIEEILAAEEEIAEVARRFAGAEHMFFIGRVRGWPVAREGAQKLKEVSYVHAEAYQAAELKHGPLALINSSMPSVVIVPADDLLSKNISTIEQIKARGGPVIAVTSGDLPAGLADAVIRVPRGEPELDPLLLNVPLQLLAYHVAAKLGRDIDKPRNLAKSVTVE